MPKVPRPPRAKKRAEPISLVDTLQQDVKVKPKVVKAKPVKADKEEEGLDAADSALLSKIAELGRDIVLDEADDHDVDDAKSEYLAEDEDEFAFPAEQFGDGSTKLATKSIGDLIFEKMKAQSLQEAEAQKLAMFSEGTRKLFGDVGLYMSHYRSGKLPKALRILPNIKNWLDLLWLCKPDEWTAHAVAAATPMFVTGFGDSECRKFLTYVLLPCVLKHIEKYDRLNQHLFKALQKALYRPSAFFTAIYLPLILDEKCNYKQAVIVNSVVCKTSVPSIQIGAAIIKLCTHHTPTNQIYYSLLRLINKKNDLPREVVRVLAKYFATKSCGDAKPVIWHQAMLVFVQRWKNELTAAEVEGIRASIKADSHHEISRAIRTELRHTAGTDAMLVG